MCLISLCHTLWLWNVHVLHPTCTTLWIDISFFQIQALSGFWDWKVFYNSWDVNISSHRSVLSIEKVSNFFEVVSYIISSMSSLTKRKPNSVMRGWFLNNSFSQVKTMGIVFIIIHLIKLCICEDFDILLMHCFHTALMHYIPNL